MKLGALGACNLVAGAVPRNNLGGEVMAVLWVWAGGDESRPDPMISYAVGDKKTNEPMDVYLVQALLNIIYSLAPSPKGLPHVPAAGSGWNALTRDYVADFQSKMVRQKKPTGVVSPPPAGTGWHTALVKKYTVARLIQTSTVSLGAMGSSNDLVGFLKENYPALVGPFRTVRKGSTWTQPTGGTSEDFHSGGNPGIETGEVSTPGFTRPW